MAADEGGREGVCVGRGGGMSVVNWEGSAVCVCCEGRQGHTSWYCNPAYKATIVPGSSVQSCFIAIPRLRTSR